jgi:hypothetical protein
MGDRDHSPEPSEEGHPPRLREAIRAARIDSAERNAASVELREAERIRLELLNEALDPLFAEVPKDVELFDRGISHGDTPRLWIDAIAHVVWSRDKRVFRLIQDTRVGRKVLAESADADKIVAAVTRYVAHRLVERERALAADTEAPVPSRDENALRWRRLSRAVRAFVFGLIIGIVALFAAAWWLVPSP